jgi:hypothetical protein
MLRQLAIEDMDRVAAIHRMSFDRALPTLAGLHMPDRVRWFFRERVFATCELWGYFEDKELVGFIAFRDGWIDHLYVLPPSQRKLAPGSDLDLLFLLPESNQSRAGAVAAATETCIKAVIAGLWDLGFVLDHAARSPRECLDLAREEPAVLASLLDRRFLWGGFGLFGALDADLAGLLLRTACRALDGRRWLSHGEHPWRRAQQRSDAGERAGREARPRRPARSAACALGQHARLRPTRSARAAGAHRGAPLSVARAVSSASSRRSRRGPSQVGAPTRRRAPAWLRRASWNKRGALSAAHLSPSRAQRAPGGGTRDTLSCSRTIRIRHCWAAHR